jgi:hypothetical protein
MLSMKLVTCVTNFMLLNVLVGKLYRHFWVAKLVGHSVISNLLVLALPYRSKPFKNSRCCQFFPESCSYTDSYKYSHSTECLISVSLATHSDSTIGLSVRASLYVEDNAVYYSSGSRS